MTLSVTTTVTILCPGECEDGELEVEVQPGEQARTYGPPEDCYPGSPPVAEILNQTCGCTPDPDLVLEDAAETLAEEEQAAIDHAADMRFEEMREERLFEREFVR